MTLPVTWARFDANDGAAAQRRRGSTRSGDASDALLSTKLTLEMVVLYTVPEERVAKGEMAGVRPWQSVDNTRLEHRERRGTGREHEGQRCPALIVLFGTVP